MHEQQGVRCSAWTEARVCSLSRSRVPSDARAHQNVGTGVNERGISLRPRDLGVPALVYNPESDGQAQDRLAASIIVQHHSSSSKRF